MDEARTEQEPYQRHQGPVASHAASRIKSPSTVRRRNVRSNSNVNGFAPSSSTPGRLRRSSTFSDAVSETRRSIKSSTDDLFFPRVGNNVGGNNLNNTDSHWHSSPLLLALLPGLGGLLFHNGAAVFTDISLLSIAAVFLNWSVRLPWEWYFAAQERVQLAPAAFDIEDLEASDAKVEKSQESTKNSSPLDKLENEGGPRSTSCQKEQTAVYKSAKRELHTHELSALALCFLFPVLAAYLLHSVRLQLSRPSEGLVSNYSLTLFLLAAEIRPVSHLLKMVQARTLYLQRVVASSHLRTLNDIALESEPVLELSKRLEELESRLSIGNSELTFIEESHTPNPSRDLVAEVRKATQGDIDALDKVIRSQERRCSAISVKLDAHIRTVNSYMADLNPLITVKSQGKTRHEYNFKYSPLLRNVISTIISLTTTPLRIAWSIVQLPMYPFSWAYRWAVQSSGSREKQRTRKLRTAQLPRKEWNQNPFA
ncbi:hypothetical protein MaudMau93_007192 [Microsporum audouinii]